MANPVDKQAAQCVSIQEISSEQRARFTTAQSAAATIATCSVCGLLQRLGCGMSSYVSSYNPKMDGVNTPRVCATGQDCQRVKKGTSYELRSKVLSSQYKKARPASTSCKKPANAPNPVQYSKVSRLFTAGTLCSTRITAWPDKAWDGAGAPCRRYQHHCH